MAGYIKAALRGWNVLFLYKGRGYTGVLTLRLEIVAVYYFV